MRWIYNKQYPKTGVVFNFAWIISRRGEVDERGRIRNVGEEGEEKGEDYRIGSLHFIYAKKKHFTWEYLFNRIVSD